MVGRFPFFLSREREIPYLPQSEEFELLDGFFPGRWFLFRSSLLTAHPLLSFSFLFSLSNCMANTSLPPFPLRKSNVFGKLVWKSYSQYIFTRGKFEEMKNFQFYILPIRFSLL